MQKSKQICVTFGSSYKFLCVYAELNSEQVLRLCVEDYIQPWWGFRGVSLMITSAGLLKLIELMSTKTTTYRVDMYHLELIQILCVSLFSVFLIFHCQLKGCSYWNAKHKRG